MKKLKLILALAVVLLTSLTLFACGSCGTPDQPTPDKAPVLSVSSDHVAGKVRTAVTLPTAEAVDEVDGDLSGQIRIKILFKDDEKYVLPTAKVSEGVLLADYPTFTPAKVGDYEITYFVVNAKGKEAVQTVSMSVAANPDDELGQNLVGTDCLDSWLAAQSGQNSTVNEYGEIVVAGASNMNYTGAVYMGQKIRNGDTVTFAFRAQPPSEVMFYNVSFLLTPNSDADQPAADEGTWPKYYNMRIGTSITTYVVTLSNNNFDLFPQINVNLCDGNVHTSEDHCRRRKGRGQALDRQRDLRHAHSNLDGAQIGSRRAVRGGLDRACRLRRESRGLAELRRVCAGRYGQRSVCAQVPCDQRQQCGSSA